MADGVEPARMDVPTLADYPFPGETGPVPPSDGEPAAPTPGDEPASDGESTPTTPAPVPAPAPDDDADHQVPETVATGRTLPAWPVGALAVLAAGGALAGRVLLRARRA